LKKWERVRVVILVGRGVPDPSPIPETHS
jgi:hypothetical protein